LEREDRMIERFSLSRTGPDGEVLYPVEGTVTIGSAADCEVGVKDAAPRQCRIMRSPAGYVLSDLTGTKVTRVNRARIERHLLRPGDVVAIGTAEFRWTVTEETEVEQVQVAASAPVRRRAPTAPIPVIAAPPKSRAVWIGSAAVAVVVLVLIALFSSSSNSARSVTRRDARPARSESRTPSSGPVPEEAPRRAPEPRPESGGVADAAPGIDPAPIVVEPFKPAVPETAPARAGAAKADPRPRTPFEQRYAALLASIERTLARGSGYEQMYKEILECSTAGAPKGAAEHLKALAASLKDAIACRECAGGKVSCEKCGGKGRIDLDCTVCQGQGRVRASGAVGNADVTVRCRNCEGKKVFKGVTCLACARSGKTTCAACRGKVWPGDGCPRPECNAGRTPCPTCDGKAFVVEKCPFCVNGRRTAPGAVNGADVTMKCRNCEIDGQTGTGNFKVECKTCRKTGKVTCNHCGGAFSSSKPPADGGNKMVETGVKATPAAKIFTREKCRACTGAGCDRCLGLGSRIRPVSDPERVLD
jgi:pSer/pThr/pTyr-binding forkhead associated (FHA) protein